MISFVSSLSSLMKTTYTIAAIAMFAVILGMSAIAPAMAGKPMEGEDHKIKFCHYQEEKLEIIVEGVVTQEAVPEDYLVIETDKKGKMNGHFKGQAQIAHHFPEDGGQGDFVITVVEDEAAEPFDNSEADCIKHNADLA